MKMEERLRNERRLGHEEGRAEGREEGLAEGEKKGERKLICKLLLNGTVDMATAVRTSGLSEEEIKEYLEQMKS
jgi:flagellar biosynthesis/type III secretory pathway protein FliH